VSLADPGSPLRGSVTLSASAADPAGVTSVTIERKPASGGTWTTICTDTKSPYSCVWDTTGVADDSYDLRATAADSLGHTTASTTVAARQVDNAAPTGTDVQVANGTGVAHKMDAGDTLTFSWSETIAPASILAGWDGSATAVTVRVTDAGNADRLAIYDAPNTTRLRITSPAQGLQLQADRAGTGGATFSATAVQSGARVTITLGALLSGTAKTATKASAMLWTPSALASDLAGNAVSSAVVSETSPAGKDF
jgi:chitinase